MSHPRADLPSLLITPTAQQFIHDECSRVWIWLLVSIDTCPFDLKNDTCHRPIGLGAREAWKPGANIAMPTG